MRRLRVRMDIMIYDAHNQASYNLQAIKPFYDSTPFQRTLLTSPLQARYKPAFQVLRPWPERASPQN